jgi:Arc/MetJ-type ribon-helix-helix transcriptional regulator
MKASKKNVTQKRRPGRPPTGQAPGSTIRLPDELRARIDSWAARQDDKPVRSEAIRRLLNLGLAKAKPLANATTVGRLGNKAVSKSSELAGKMIDRLSDQSAPLEEQEKRKRRLLKGPAEFRDMRDLASQKRRAKTRTSAR